MGAFQILSALLLLILCTALAVMVINPLHRWLESPPDGDNEYDQEWGDNSGCSR